MYTRKIELARNGADGCYALGRQVAIEFYNCHPDRLLDPRYLEASFLTAARESGATVIGSSFHSFSPQGVSGVVTIAESHFTVHTWPEHDYAAVDIFTCGDSIDIDKAIRILKDSMDSRRVVISTDRNRGLMSDLPGMEETAETILENPGLYPVSWKRVYEEVDPWGVLASIDVHDCDPGVVRDVARTRAFIDDLCSGLGMEGECQVQDIGEGEASEGFSVTRVAGPSFVCGQVVTGAGTVYLDIFCRNYYDPRTLAEAAVRFFKGSNYKLQLALRR